MWFYAKYFISVFSLKNHSKLTIILLKNAFFKHRCKYADLTNKYERWHKLITYFGLLLCWVRRALIRCTQSWYFFSKLGFGGSYLAAVPIFTSLYTIKTWVRIIYLTNRVNWFLLSNLLPLNSAILEKMWVFVKSKTISLIDLETFNYFQIPSSWRRTSTFHFLIRELSYFVSQTRTRSSCNYYRWND